MLEVPSAAPQTPRAQCWRRGCNGSTGCSPRSPRPARGTHPMHGLGPDLIVVDPRRRIALLHTADRLESELNPRDALQRLAVALAGRALAKPRQQLAVDLDGCGSRCSHSVLRSYRCCPGSIKPYGDH